MEFEEVAAVVERADFFSMGYRSPTDWLAATTRESIGHCRTTLAIALRLGDMPIVRAAFADGLIAETSLRILTEEWNPDIADVFSRDEKMLAGWACSLPQRDLRLVVDTWRLHADPTREERSAEERFESRALHLSSLLDGMGRIDGNLDTEGLALVREAIRALSQPCDGETRTASQRRADALTEMARLTIAHLDPEPGRRRRRPKVIATISWGDLAENAGGGALDTDLDTSVVSAESIRRMACDSNVHRYVTNPLGTVVDFGRSQRVVTDTLFDTLMIRDHGCRWAGCGIPAGSCDAHHAVHWIDGGETEPDNLVLLCWFHHHLLHEQHWRIEPLGGGHFTLRQPSGVAHRLRPPMVGAALPVRPTLPRPAEST